METSPGTDLLEVGPVLPAGLSWSSLRVAYGWVTIRARPGAFSGSLGPRHPLEGTLHWFLPRPPTVQLSGTSVAPAQSKCLWTKVDSASRDSPGLSELQRKQTPPRSSGPFLGLLLTHMCPQRDRRELSTGAAAFAISKYVSPSSGDMALFSPNAGPLRSPLNSADSFKRGWSACSVPSPGVVTV